LENRARQIGFKRHSSFAFEVQRYTLQVSIRTDKTEIPKTLIPEDVSNIYFLTLLSFYYSYKLWLYVTCNTKRCAESSKAKMPQGRRKVPFSGKAKKAQLQSKKKQKKPLEVAGEKG
jgi:hypothetical protein